MYNLWSDERNRLSGKMVKAEIYTRAQNLNPNPIYDGNGIGIEILTDGIDWD